MTSEREATAARASVSALKGVNYQTRYVSKITKYEIFPDASVPRDVDVGQLDITEKSMAHATYDLPNHRPMPIEPENERKHAGDVARRSNAMPRALPPPKPAASSSTRVGRIRDKDKRREKKSFGDDSEDDSEEDRRRRKSDDRSDGGVLNKKPATVLPSTSSSLLAAEEQERIRLRRTLRAAEERWDKIKMEKYNSWEQIIDREEALVTMNRKQAILSTAEIRKKILNNDKMLQAFLDNTLFHYIKDQSDRIQNQLQEGGNREGDISSHYYQEDVLKRIEDGVIARCRAFDEWASIRRRRWDVTPPSKSERLISISLQMQKTFWQEVKDMTTSDDDLAEITIRSHIRERLKNQDADKGLSLGPANGFVPSVQKSEYDVAINDVESKYLELIVTSVAKAIAQDIKAGLSDPHESSLELINIFKSSRDVGKHLSQDYVQWVTSVLDETQLSLLCESWFKSVRQETLYRFRKDLSGVELKQEFIDSAENPTDVSIVLFKAGVVANVVEVSPKQLSELGWLRDNRKERYWRYSEGRSFVNHIFKVQMNGSIVGILTSHIDHI